MMEPTAGTFMDALASAFGCCADGNGSFLPSRLKSSNSAANRFRCRFRFFEPFLLDAFCTTITGANTHKHTAREGKPC